MKWAAFLPLGLALLFVAIFGWISVADQQEKPVASSTEPMIMATPIPFPEVNLVVIPIQPEDGIAETKVPLSPATLKGKYTLINLFSSWCAPCRQEHPILQQLAKQVQLPIIGVAWQDEPERIQIFLQAEGSPYHQVLWDQAGELAVALGATGLPESYLVNQQGEIIRKWIGPLTEADIAFLAQLTREQEHDN